jgi:pyruvate formate lyase activating enzyme
MEIVGKTMTVDEVIYEIEKDKQFYSNSEGGVTFSGGEPILHSEFLHSIVPKLKEKGIHVAIETTGYGEWEEFFKVVKDMDLILFDLKEMNSEKHDKYTGVHNQLIIENAKKISKIKETIFRLPVIPGYNDEIENFKQVVTLLKELDHECSVHLLPYHTYGKEKYKKLGKKYNLPEVESPSKEDMQKIANIFEKSDIKASIV